jgi:hypothetical protein
MAFSEFEMKKVQVEVGRFIEAQRPPAEMRDQLDLGFKIENQSIILFEIRPRGNKPEEKIEAPVAKTTYLKSRGSWKVYWMRADLKWHKYEPYPELDQLVDFLDIVEADEYGCFWG